MSSARPDLRPVVLTDLDDTIFTTMKGYGGCDPSTLRQVSEATNGNHSFMCERRDAIFAWIGSSATVIPVTARSLGAFRRVFLHFPEGAILSNGAVILTADGEPDPLWTRQTAELCAAAAPDITEALRVAEGAGAPGDYRHAVHRQGETVIGMTIKSNLHDEDDAAAAAHLASIRSRIVNSGLQLTTAIHGNNLAILPPGISKSTAVEYLLDSRRDLAGRPLIGAGDAPSDLPFMKLCDMILVPNRTGNAERLFGKDLA